MAQSAILNPKCKGRITLQNTLQLLIELQEIERKVRGLAEQKARAPIQIAVMQEEESKAEGRLEEKEEMLKSAQRLRRELEREVEDLEGRKSKSKQRLLEVKSNKEYQAILKEIDDIEDLIRRREDQIIEQMEVAESLAGEVQEHKRLLAEAHKRLEQEGAQLEKEAAKADTLIASLEEQKELLKPQIPPEMLQKYQLLSANRGGVALAPVNRATCQVCHMNLPPQICIDLQKNEKVMHCPNCQRIIYWVGHEAYKQFSHVSGEPE
jgi:predicted  nucleic acid-binding Zn-ribbon protein